MLSLLKDFRAPDVCNPWRGRDALDLSAAAGAERLDRLERHLDCRARLVLVGEAAGYQGCRYSGIPFTSERLLLEGAIPRVSCPARLTRRARPWSEPSASILWGTLHELGIAPQVVLWNAFPWHPHLPDQPHSNRRPTRAELARGAPALRALVERFSGAQIVAVGQVAHDALTRLLGTAVPRVRHPAYGGATEFAQGIRTLVKQSGIRRHSGELSDTETEWS